MEVLKNGRLSGRMHCMVERLACARTVLDVIIVCEVGQEALLS